MHEMAIAENILNIIDQELAKNNCTKLTLVRVRYGVLSQVVPDSLQFCFEAVTKDGPHQGALLEMEEVPLILRCGMCHQSFSPAEGNPFEPCPHCQATMGHDVEQGRELYVQHLEAE